MAIAACAASIAISSRSVASKDAPPSFITCAGWGDKVHAVWADEYFSAMLNAGIPNVEMHIYAIGHHGLGLTYRDGTALGTWQNRFTDWFHDLGFLQKTIMEEMEALAVVEVLDKPKVGLMHKETIVPKQFILLELTVHLVEGVHKALLVIMVMMVVMELMVLMALHLMMAKFCIN